MGGGDVQLDSAGLGAGIYKDLKTAAKELVKWDRVYKPDMKNYKLYNDIESNWQKAYEVQLKLIDKGVTTSMCKAPRL